MQTARKIRSPSPEPKNAVPAECRDRVRIFGGRRASPERLLLHSLGRAAVTLEEVDIGYLLAVYPLEAPLDAFEDGRVVQPVAQRLALLGELGGVAGELQFLNALA